eukprot:TRINITY_DN38417_c0_g1_i2.p1 TRINITY_DN38417_c0_g1~~TRINITY_DN38417_c0_g1_i2.p1  ORF type:complete len:1278 (-),score=221.38 TRINITY_DN38417_c0_g1_i2:159-3884(-)
MAVAIASPRLGRQSQPSVPSQAALQRNGAASQDGGRMEGRFSSPPEIQNRDRQKLFASAAKAAAVAASTAKAAAANAQRRGGQLTSTRTPPLSGASTPRTATPRRASAPTASNASGKAVSATKSAGGRLGMPGAAAARAKLVRQRGLAAQQSAAAEASAEESAAVSSNDASSVPEEKTAAPTGGLHCIGYADDDLEPDPEVAADPSAKADPVALAGGVLAKELAKLAQRSGRSSTQVGTSECSLGSRQVSMSCDDMEDHGGDIAASASSFGGSSAAQAPAAGTGPGSQSSQPALPVDDTSKTQPLDETTASHEAVIKSAISEVLLKSAASSEARVAPAPSIETVPSIPRTESSSSKGARRDSRDGGEPMLPVASATRSDLQASTGEFCTPPLPERNVESSRSSFCEVKLDSGTDALEPNLFTEKMSETGGAPPPSRQDSRASHDSTPAASKLRLPMAAFSRSLPLEKQTQDPLFKRQKSDGSQQDTSSEAVEAGGSSLAESCLGELRSSSQLKLSSSLASNFLRPLDEADSPSNRGRRLCSKQSATSSLDPRNWPDFPSPWLRTRGFSGEADPLMPETGGAPTTGRSRLGTVLISTVPEEESPATFKQRNQMLEEKVSAASAERDGCRRVCQDVQRRVSLLSQLVQSKVDEVASQSVANSSLPATAGDLKHADVYREMQTGLADIQSMLAPVLSAAGGLRSGDPFAVFAANNVRAPAASESTAEPGGEQAKETTVADVECAASSSAVSDAASARKAVSSQQGRIVSGQSSPALAPSLSPTPPPFSRPPPTDEAAAAVIVSAGTGAGVASPANVRESTPAGSSLFMLSPSTDMASATQPRSLFGSSPPSTPPRGIGTADAFASSASARRTLATSTPASSARATAAVEAQPITSRRQRVSVSPATRSRIVSPAVAMTWPLPGALSQSGGSACSRPARADFVAPAVTANTAVTPLGWTNTPSVSVSLPYNGYAVDLWSGQPVLVGASVASDARVGCGPLVQSPRIPSSSPHPASRSPSIPVSGLPMTSVCLHTTADGITRRVASRTPPLTPRTATRVVSPTPVLVGRPCAAGQPVPTVHSVQQAPFLSGTVSLLSTASTVSPRQPSRGRSFTPPRYAPAVTGPVRTSSPPRLVAAAAPMGTTAPSTSVWLAEPVAVPPSQRSVSPVSRRQPTPVDQSASGVSRPPASFAIYATQDEDDMERTRSLRKRRFRRCSETADAQQQTDGPWLHEEEQRHTLNAQGNKS